MTKKDKKELIKEMTEYINKQFENGLVDRKKLFLELEKWAGSLGEGSEIFLTALYSAENTKIIQLELALDRGLERIRGNK